jgi:hypothetical protein
MTSYFKIFKKGKKQGLPRPMVRLDDYFLNNFSHGLHKNNPVPWQSTPIFNEKGNIFYVIEDNEKRVLPEGLCGYCSVKFSDDEICIRWMGDGSKHVPNDEQGPRMISDTHPLHLECMRQTRVYCTHMRERPDSEFETGTYSELREKTVQFLNSFKNN